MTEQITREEIKIAKKHMKHISNYQVFKAKQTETICLPVKFVQDTTHCLSS